MKFFVAFAIVSLFLVSQSFGQVPIYKAQVNKAQVNKAQKVIPPVGVEKYKDIKITPASGAGKVTDLGKYKFKLLPDLVLEAIYFTNQGQVYIVVRNDGLVAAPAKSFVMLGYFNEKTGAPILTTQASLPAVPAGQKVWVDMKNNKSLYNIRLDAWVDQQNLIPELNENNNFKSGAQLFLK
jgi:hypothetical protein